MRIFFLFILLNLPLIASALQCHSPAKEAFSLNSALNFYDTNLSVQGGIYHKIFQLPKGEKKAPKIFFQKKEFSSRLKGEGQYEIWIPLRMTLKPGTHFFTLRFSKKTLKHSFKVSSRKFDSQSLHVKKKFASPPKGALLKQILLERKEIVQAMSFRSKPLSHLLFSVPSKESIISGNFGNYRIYNHIKKRGHNGTDIALKRGTPVHSIAKGKVVLSGKYFYTGNTVFVDHGDSLLSLYFHLSKLMVKKGDTLKRGDLVGLVGATGRVTGPHLHLSIQWHGVKLEPTLFLPKMSFWVAANQPGTGKQTAKVCGSNLERHPHLSKHSKEATNSKK